MSLYVTKINYPKQIDTPRSNEINVSQQIVINYQEINVNAT